MKKLIILFICSSFTFLTFAQEKKEPTKKETFDFIIYAIKKSMNVDIKDSNSNDYSINLVYNFTLSSRDKYSKHLNLNFEQLDVVKKEYGTVYGDETTNNQYPKIELYFKSSNDNEFVLIGFLSSQSETRDKLYKALNHWIKLTKGIDTSLFDD